MHNNGVDARESKEAFAALQLYTIGGVYTAIVAILLFFLVSRKPLRH